MKKIKQFQFWTRIVLWAVAALFFLLCFYRYWAFGGVLTIHDSFRHETTRFTQSFEPGVKRLENLTNKSRYIEIATTPTTTRLFVPRQFDSVDVAVTFVNNKQRLVEFGVANLVSPLIPVMQPLEIALEQEAVEAGWSRVDNKQEGWTLYKREGQLDVESLSDLEEIQNNSSKRIGVYSSIAIPPFVSMADYVPLTAMHGGDLQLQGSHQFMAYVGKGEVLHFEAKIIDANITTGSDPVTLIAQDARGVIVGQAVLDDDDNISADRIAGEERSIQLSVNGLSDGVYTLSLQGSNDVFITGYSTLQQYVVLAKRARLVDKEAWERAIPNKKWMPQTIETPARTIQFDASDSRDAVVAIVVDGEGNKTNVYQPLTGLRSQWTIDSQANTNHANTVDFMQEIEALTPRLLTISASAALSVPGSKWFDSFNGIEIIDETMQLADIDMLIVPYQNDLEVTPFEKKRTVTLPLSGIVGDHKTPYFVVQVPGLLTSRDSVAIQDIQYTFHREPIWNRIQDRLKK